jgi:ribonuclease MRP protein subunit RMP1
MAALARLAKITGISREMKVQIAAGKIKAASPVVVKEDLGERIRRVDDAPMTRPVKTSQSEKPVSKEKPEKDRSTSKSTKKMKKKKNAIDDLFSGLF